MTSSTPGKFATFKGTTTKIWRLSLPYFQSDEKWKARALLAASEAKAGKPAAKAATKKAA